jgi:excinuclease UvrABC ATPase subunit
MPAHQTRQQLHKKGSVYVLDEPTTGLHISDTPASTSSSTA